ncbi:MAG: hypothetical protein MUF29_08280 [Chitinophagaceae bacterium]|jgi:uncharacterized membrane protein YdcZ (DUF606 family)|nr:hypothetical protein [Chitinophagaceae bacterium]
MGQLPPLIFAVILLSGLLYSKYLLDRAGLMLQEKERIAANRLLQSVLVMNVLLSLLYLVLMVVAARNLASQHPWRYSMGISGIFTVLYILLNNRLYRQFDNLGFPESFGNIYVLSRVVLLVSLLVFAHYLFNLAQTFAFH